MAIGGFTNIQVVLLLLKMTGKAKQVDMRRAIHLARTGGAEGFSSRSSYTSTLQKYRGILFDADKHGYAQLTRAGERAFKEAVPLFNSKLGR